MQELNSKLHSEIQRISSKFLETIKNKELQVISHFDTDGISSAAIMVNCLRKLDQKFTLKIVKSLSKEIIDSLPKNKITLFLDLASSSTEHIKQANLKEVFILDHHEIDLEIPENIEIINPELNDKEKISASGIVYLFCKQINETNKEFAKLAILGMVGDGLEKEIDKLNHGILEDSDVLRKKGLILYPSTRPLNRTLEFCSEPFIPGVTGNSEGVFEILREANIKPEEGKYKNLIDLTNEEIDRLTTAIMLRNPKIKNKKLVGEILLIKLFGKLEDVREISAKINACSRFGESAIALRFCLESPLAKKRAESIHAKYRQLLLTGLKEIENSEKIQGEKFLIINAKEKIKDTMIGTLMSILSYSSLYSEETIIVGLAKNSEKIKVSARNVGRKGRNIREILEKVVTPLGGEVGGHEFAAGCTIMQEKEKDFLEALKRNLELQVIKI